MSGTPAILLRLSDANDKVSAVDFSSRIMSFEFEDNAKLVDKCVLKLDNSNLDLFDEARFRLGSRIEVAWGYHGDLTDVRKMRITSIKGWRELEIEALGFAIDLNKIARARRFENMTRSQVVQAIAGEYGLDALVADTAVKYPSIMQPATLTDAQFLRKLAQQEGYDLWIDKDGVHFHPSKWEGAPVAELVYYTGDGAAAGIVNVRYEEDTKKKKGAVATRSRDPKTKKAVEGSASNDGTKRATLSGVVAAEAPPADERKKVDKTTGALTKYTAESAMAPTSETNPKAVQRAADAAYRDSQRSTVKMTFTILGDPRVLARRIIRIAGIPQRLVGNYWVAKAKHRIDMSGYLIDVETKRDGHNGYGARVDIKSKGDLNKKDVDKKTTERVKAVDKTSGESTYTFRTK